ncbi:Transferase family domain containing protein [Naviculisporaceae sp. PSN 640]
MQTSYTFSPLDEIMPPLWMTLVLCFPCPDSQKDHVTQTLQQGLSRMVAERPFLAGKLKRDGDDATDGARPGSLSLEIPENPVQEVKLAINDMSLPGSGWDYSYDDLRAAGMPLSKLDGGRLSPVAYGVASASNRVFEARLSFIPGGCFLSVSTCHAFVDAWGFIVIMNMWASCCRDIQAGVETRKTPKESETNLDDGSSRPPALFANVSKNDYQALKDRPELWQLLGLDWRHIGKEGASPGPTPFNHPSLVKTRMFTVSPSSLDAIKQSATPAASEANGTDDGNTPKWISTKDALVAFLWRSIIKARAPSWPAQETAPESNTQSMVSVAIDGRRALSPPLPLSYIGNVVFCCLTWLPIAKLLDPQTPLSTIALEIRSSIEQKARNPHLLADAVNLAASIPDVSKGLGNAFTSWFGKDLVTTSVVDLPIYHLDFGAMLGKPEFFRMPKGQFDGICMIQPRQRNGMVDVIISLEPEQMDCLVADGEFSRHMVFLSE